MRQGDHRIVMFSKYCSNCKYLDKKQHEEPCNECLDNPVNLHSEKPVKYVEDKKKK